MITNSLGSNYDPEFISLSKQLAADPNNSRYATDVDQLIIKLDQRYQGKTTLLYKARHAIATALKHFDIGRGDTVLTQAFTCYAVEQAIILTGAQPIFADTAANSLNLSLDSIKSAYLGAKVKPKALVVQHTIGFPVSTQSIKSWCQKNSLYLIEDLAHSAGALYDHSLPVGHYADAVVLSFGQDKIIDAVTGGALINKNTRTTKEAKSVASSPLPVSYLKKQLYYPELTYQIRHLHPLLGKLLHRYNVFSGHITSPIATPSSLHTPLPAVFAHLTLYSLNQLASQIAHRRQIANIYHQNLHSPSLLINSEDISRGSCLRYPLLVTNRTALLTFLKHHRFELFDVWYRHPVETGRLPIKSVYPVGSCPNAEHLSAEVINLPTHINVSPAQALQLANLINNFH